MIFSHLDFVSIHPYEITDIILKNDRERVRRIKEKFSKKNIDRYPDTRQLMLELFASAHIDPI